MRIKMYENFLSDVDVIKNRISFISNFKENVENIFVDLLDEKYLVDVSVTNNNNNYKGYFKCCVVIQLSNLSNKETFRFEDIRDSLVMFEDYTKEYVNKDFEIEIAYHEDNSEYGFTDVVKSFENFGGDMEWLESADMNRLKIDVYVKHD
jgi:hypothetical protein